MAGEDQQQQGLDALSVGKAAELLLFAQVEPREQILGVALIPAGIDAADEIHVPAQRLARVQAHVIRCVADVPLHRDLRLRQGLPERFDLAAVGADEPHQQAHQGRLARAVHADQAHDLADRQFQLDVAQGEPVVLLVHAFQRDGGTHFGFLSGGSVGGCTACGGSCSACSTRSRISRGLSASFLAASSNPFNCR